MSIVPFSLRPLALALSLVLAVPAFANDEHGAARHAEPAARPVKGEKPEKGEKAAAHGEDKVESRAEAKLEPKSESKGEAKSEEKAEARQPKAAPPTPDPMNRLRERLAEKLGSPKAAEPVSPTMLRVVSTSSPAPATESEKHLAGERRTVAMMSRPAPSARPATERRASPMTASGREPMAMAGAAPHAAHWGYAGADGPDTWGAMKPENATCSTGQRQSPIDIRDGIKVQLDPVQFDYRAGGFAVIDNGHTVQVNVAPGNSIEVLGKRFELVQFHFHRPSEERINGKQFDMVVHLVHKNVDGQLAVIAVLLDRGMAQPIVQAVWNNLPLEKGDAVAARTSLDLNELLPADRSYFTYMGSLTTPPCSEGVLWMVMKTPVGISQDQLAIFSRLYPMNARPIQAASGRLIKESN